MEIRSATIADVALCERIEPVYHTRYVWKVEHQDAEGLIAVSFTRARLPQEMPVEAPYSADDLFALWQQRRCFLVAEDAGRVRGYVIMEVRPAGEGWISHLLVDAAGERQGVAARLLEGVEAWGRQSRLAKITVAVQSRNDPLISLLPQRGYAFRGFIETYFAAGETALLFGLAL